jgi:hypothetical protein
LPGYRRHQHGSPEALAISAIAIIFVEFTSTSWPDLFRHPRLF